jgi:Putative metallopeptidase
MKRLGPMSRGLVAAVIGLTSGLSTLAAAQSPDASGTIADNDAIFVDGKTFTITTGKAKGAAPLQIRTSGAQELGAGAIIFRVNGRLYMVDAPPFLRTSIPGRQAADVGADDAQVNRLRIEYEPPKNPKHQMLYETIKERQVLEMLQHMLAPFRFPVEVTIKTMGCDGLINSWFSYDDSVPTIHMCYELLQDIIKMMPPEATPVLGVMPHDAVVGQFLFWSLHELGHAVFHIFEVPLLGREEDAADQFSVYLMLQFGKDQAHRWVEGAAYGAHRFLTDYQENPAVQKRLEKFASVHGLPEQRFYNGLCMAYGADAKLFADVVENGLLPKMRADNCEHEYQTFAYAFKTQIRPHIDLQMAKAVLNMTWFPEPPLRPFPR